MLKSLLYREWLIGKKNYIAGIAGITGVTILAYLVRLSLMIGNLSHLEPDALENVNELTMSLFVVLLPMLYFQIMGDNGVHASDIQSHYQMFGYTLPVSALQRTVVKYILKISGFLIGCLYSWVLVMLMRSTVILSDDALLLDEIVPAVYLVAVGTVLIDTYKSALLLRCRTARQCSAVNALAPFPLLLLLICGMAVFVAQIGAYMAANPDDYEGFFDHLQETLTHTMQRLPGITAAVTVVLFAVGFVLSWLSMKRREK